MNIKERIFKILNKIIGRPKYPTLSNYAEYLRAKGIRVGKGLKVFSTDISIDATTPELVEIGDNVRLNKGFRLLTHDDVGAVLRNVFHNFVQNKGAVKIGNNVDFGMNVAVLKGVTIGDNVFVAFGSVVTKDIPANCIAAGIPARPICTLEEYWKKQNEIHLDSTFELLRAIKDSGREPRPKDLSGSFSLFLDASNYEEYPEVPVKYQLQDNFDYWLSHHKRMFDSFEDLMQAFDKYYKKSDNNEESR